MRAPSKTTATRSRIALFAALCVLPACDIAQTCDQEPPTPAGDLDRIGDAVLVSPSAAGSAGQNSWVVMTNPEIQQLRVFDVLERQFVRAPNVFFPLSLRTGPATRRLATPVGDGSRVFALDSSDDTLTVVSITPHVDVREGEQAPDFRAVLVAETGRAPADVAGILTEDALLAFVTLPDESALQVLELDVEAATSTEVARIDLGEGSSPSRVEVDPTGDALVVTDARLSSVAIVRVADLTLDRRIEIGGPSGPVAIGRVDPGDGLAPMALVSRRDTPELAAIRLRRPGFREEPYELIARMHIHDLAATVHVNDAARIEPRSCGLDACDVSTCDRCGSSANCSDGEMCASGRCVSRAWDKPTFAWGAFVAANGFMRYVRFDGERGERWTGTNIETPASSDRGLLRYIGAFSPQPTVTDVSWEPGAEDDPQPLVQLQPIDDLGDPPLFRLFEGGQTLNMTFEGTPAGTGNRRATLVPAGDAWRVNVSRDSLDFDDRDVEDGDVIRINTSTSGGSCPDVVESTISSIAGDSFIADDITAATAACVNQTNDFRFTLFAAGDFVLNLDGYRGRLPLSVIGQSIAIPGWVVTVTGDSAPSRGSRFVLNLIQGRAPLILDLAAPATTEIDGFGTLGLLATSITSGVVDVRDLETGEIETRNRLFVATGAGALLEMEESELLVGRISLHR